MKANLDSFRNSDAYSQLMFGLLFIALPQVLFLYWELNSVAYGHLLLVLAVICLGELATVWHWANRPRRWAALLSEHTFYDLIFLIAVPLYILAMHRTHLDAVSQYALLSICALTPIRLVIQHIANGEMERLPENLLHDINDRTADVVEKIAAGENRGSAVQYRPQNSDESIIHPAVKAKINFSNVVGMADVKKRLLDAGSEVLTRMRTREEARNGIILYGDPGNGKTFFAEALAGELKLPIIKVSFGDVVSHWVGERTEKIMQVFIDAAKQAPCVLFIDEIDSLIRDRKFSLTSGDTEEPKVTNAILTSLVKIRDHGVVVVAATNFLDVLDGAAIREKRFDFKIEITAPDAEARMSLIENAVAMYKGMQLSASAISQATKRWEGFSVARILAVVDEACRTAKAAGNGVIEYTDLQMALRLTQGNQGDAIPVDTPLLDGVIMPEDQLSKLKGIAHRMKHIEEVEDLGGTVPTGILFYGPPGTGKTMTVRSLAKTTGWALKSVSGSDLMADMRKVDEIASFAKHNRPCIIFIDEADDVLGHRGMSGGSATALTNKLLATIDGANGKTPDVMWVAATNNPDSLDDAAMRGGRFTEKIGFSAPDANIASRLIAAWIAKTKASFADNVTGETAAALLDGEAPANINAILQQAVNIMIERKAQIGVATQVSLGDIEKARIVVVGK